MEAMLSFLSPHEDSGLFLGLILAVFLLGLVVLFVMLAKFYFKYRAASEPYIQNVNGIAEEEPEAYLLRATRLDSIMRTVAPFPSVLVTIGILGTFIGIGMAISEAIPALEQDGDVGVVQDALKALLNAVKFKFQTSAYGILASLVFIAIEQLVSALLHNQVSTRAVALAPHRVSLAAQLARGLSKGVERGFDSMGKSLHGSIESLTSSTAQLEREAKSLSSGALMFAEGVESFGLQVTQTTGALSNSSAKLGDLGKDIDASLARVSELLSAAVRENMQESRRAQQESSAMMRAALEDMKTTLRDNLDEARSSQEQGMARLLQGQQHAAEQLQQSMDEALDSLNATVTDLSASQSEGMRELAEYQSEASAALKKLAITLADFERQSTRMIDIADKLGGSAAMPEPPPRRASERVRSEPRSEEAGADFL